MLKLLAFDNKNYPFEASKRVTFETTLDHFDLSEIQVSSMLINKEINKLKNELNLENLDSEKIYEIQE